MSAIAEAQPAHAAERHAKAAAQMRPAIGGTYRLGASQTPQDVLEQSVVDADLRAGSRAPHPRGRSPAFRQFRRLARSRPGAVMSVSWAQ